MSAWIVEQSECLDALRRIPDACVSALVTDPPAGIAFMGKDWDSNKGGRDSWIAWLRDVMREALRVLKPGAYGLVWALPRTSHWTATALEDAGFEVRDVITHLFGSGFPKSRNISLDLDALAGVEPTVVGSRKLGGKGGTYGVCVGTAPAIDVPITEPTSPEARAWKGWGTALKPASEHWILVRKPLSTTLARNVLAHGTGGINVDACRIEVSAADRSNVQGREWVADNLERGAYGEFAYDGARRAIDYAPGGRWPANVTLDEEAAALLDQQSGNRPGMSGGGKHKPDYAGGMFGSIDAPHLARGDSGGASRFFYVAKPSTKEREFGCESLPKKSAAELVEREEGSDGKASPRAGAGRTSKGRANHHPTVKSIALMRWLVRLVTPPGGVILDPFAGSGTTGCAAVLEGFNFAGIEQDADYVAIARARISAAKETK